MKNVLVLMPVEARHKEKIEAAGKDCSIVYSTPDQVTEEQIRSLMTAVPTNLQQLILHAKGPPKRAFVVVSIECLRAVPSALSRSDRSRSERCAP